ncbi:hypothetical protein ABZ864_40505 [Streptomyces sp. NPDC047082]|uniref:hypothetical protein n=1 Tax=Streptomyces sp. NPDC047082 TaxID=3155259 RepID=UPI0033CBFEA0
MIRRPQELQPASDAQTSIRLTVVGTRSISRLARIYATEHGDAADWPPNPMRGQQIGLEHREYPWLGEVAVTDTATSLRKGLRAITTDGAADHCLQGEKW